MDFSAFNLDPIAFSIGPLVIRWYALAYLAGFLLGWKYCLMQVTDGEDIRPNKNDVDNFLTWAIIGVIIGGRLGYVIFYQPAYFFEYPSEIFKLWRGGMSFHGGMLGVMVAMFGYSAKHRIEVFKLSDIVCAAAPIGLFFGRLANFINAELYGRITDHPFGVIFPGQTQPRHPSQIYEAVLEGLVLFVILYILSRKGSRPGIITGMFLVGYGTFRGLVEFVREPDPQIGLIGNYISMGQILCIPMILAGTAVISIALHKGKRADA